MYGLTLILGGARAGKSDFAVRLARASGRPVIYCATAEARDEEMATRIAVHRATRPTGWRTVEAPLDPAAALAEIATAGDLLVLDCVTLWVSNMVLAAGEPYGTRAEGVILAAVERLLAWRADRGCALVAVSNEVGLGEVPLTPLGRAYRDALGRANRALAAAADEAYWVVAGLALPLRALGARAVG